MLTRLAGNLFDAQPLVCAAPNKNSKSRFILPRALMRPRKSRQCGAPSTRRTLDCVTTMRRPGPYEERARELARAAGLDPDARVERPGQRSMPLWCTYRDAARQEHLAREADALRAHIAPQAPQFQNSP